mgnify:CR=1 FL=1
MPALIRANAFLNNNAGGSPGDNAETGTGVFISNGPANNPTIAGNQFSPDSQTAINFAGHARRPSVRLRVQGNHTATDSPRVRAPTRSARH